MHGWRHVPDDDSQKGKVMIPNNIYDVDHDRIVPGKEIFGHDWNRFAAVCDKVYHHVVRFNNIHSPGCQAFFDEFGSMGWFNKKHPGESEFDWIQQYDMQHPVEYQHYQKLLDADNAERSREFRILYGIAQRRHVRVVWDETRPDRFDLYRYGNRIGYAMC